MTGHTGFKGAWLCEWLLSLGARVVGYALPSPTDPALFEHLALAERIEHQIGDIRNVSRLREVTSAAQPDFVFHLAGKAIVRDCYEQPDAAFEVNALGTLRLLEALRTLEKPAAAVLVTTDKCYDNRGWVFGYRERDALGGADPYSASKAAAEIVVDAWRRSFFRDHPVKLATARAGNAIGGGDWARDRIVPDCIRALTGGETIAIRNAEYTRPWQHVLEALSGYLWLGAVLTDPSLVSTRPEGVEGAFNFGPSSQGSRTVGELVEALLEQWPGRWELCPEARAPSEAGRLSLCADKACELLHWQPVWDFSRTVQQVARWYRELHGSPRTETAGVLTRAQIAEYTADAQKLGLRWAS